MLLLLTDLRRRFFKKRKEKRTEKKRVETGRKRKLIIVYGLSDSTIIISGLGLEICSLIKCEALRYNFQFPRRRPRT